LSVQYSKVKLVSFELLNIIDQLVQPELNNQWLKKIWNYFALTRGRQIIINKPDEELKSKMHVSFQLMQQVFNQIEIAEQIKESDALNEGKGHEFVKKINKDVLDLIP